MKIKDGFVLREVGGKNYAVATGDALTVFNGMISLNGVGAFIFKLLQEETDKNSVVSKICEEYDVEKEKAEQDFDKFVEQLIPLKIIEE